MLPYTPRKVSHFRCRRGGFHIRPCNLKIAPTHPGRSVFYRNNVCTISNPSSVSATPPGASVTAAVR